jgi:hypothetical protein
VGLCLICGESFGGDRHDRGTPRLSQLPNECDGRIRKVTRVLEMTVPIEVIASSHPGSLTAPSVVSTWRKKGLFCPMDRAFVRIIKHDDLLLTTCQL